MLYLEREAPRYERSLSIPDDLGDFSFWKTTPERLEAHRIQMRGPNLAERFSKFVRTGLATLVLAGGFALSQPVPTQHNEASYHAEERTDSLWRIAEAHLNESLPQTQPARDQALIAATDTLASENGLCPPSTWNAEHPVARYDEAHTCADGSPSPHILEYGRSISVDSLEQTASKGDVQSAGSGGVRIAELPFLSEPGTADEVVVAELPFLFEGSGSEPYDSSEPYESQGPEHSSGAPETGTLEEIADSKPEGSSTPWRDWLSGGVGLAGIIGSAAYAFEKMRSIAREKTVRALDEEFLNPQTALNATPRGNTTLAFGHAYLAERHYLDRTSQKPTTGRRYAGAALRSMERKAARLNRLGAVLDNAYDARPLGDMVREAIGENLTDRTAHNYVRTLAQLGHGNAQAYLSQLPAPKRVRSKKRSSKAKAERKAQKTS
jgi:hypothetical protein